MPVKDDVLVSNSAVGDVTYTEWHAALLGVVPGGAAGLGLLVGLHEPVFGLTIAVLLAAGVIRARGGLTPTKVAQACKDCIERVAWPESDAEERERARAENTVRREPWWFLVTYAVSTMSTYGVGAWLML